MIGTSSLRSIVTSRPTPWMAASTSSRNAVPSATSGAQDTSTPSVSRLPDHHLFDVEQLDTVLGQHLEKRRRHAWLIHAGDGDQHRHLGWCGHPRMPPIQAIKQRTSDVVDSGDVAALFTVSAADVGFGAHPFHHVRVVQLECRPLRTDSGQLGEVVPRRRAAGRPLQRVAVAPWVVDGDDLAVAPALEDVPHEREHRRAQDEGADGRDDVQYRWKSSLGR